MSLINSDATLLSTYMPLRTSVNVQTDSYTLVLSDAFKEIKMNVGSANNLTVPPASSVAWTAGDQVIIFQYGAGETTIVAGSGVTIRNPHATYKMIGQYRKCILEYLGSDEWVLTGEISET